MNYDFLTDLSNAFIKHVVTLTIFELRCTHTGYTSFSYVQHVTQFGVKVLYLRKLQVYREYENRNT